MPEAPKPGDLSDILAELQVIISGQTAPPAASPSASIPAAPPLDPSPAPQPASPEPKTPPAEESGAISPEAPITPAASPKTPPPPVADFTILIPGTKPDFSSVPKNQIRRVALLYLSGQEEKLKQLFKMLESSARAASKDPIYIDLALVVKMNPTGTKFEGLVDKVRASQAIAAFGILSGLHWMSLKELGQEFKSAEIFFRAIDESAAQKKESIVDLAIELLLLGSS